MPTRLSTIHVYRVFQPEGAEYKYDFKRGKQMRIDDPSLCRSFRITYTGATARVRCMRPAPPSQHSLHPSLPPPPLALASLHYPTRLQVAATFGGAGPSTALDDTEEDNMDDDDDGAM